jgi:nucleoside 2-deoxyribosyltransferase
MRIYFAGPLFCEAERAFNLALATKLEDLGFSVFLPQRDGVELQEAFAREMSENELCQMIFNFDRDQLLKSDIFLLILDGRVPDEGACVELGIAHENKVSGGQVKLLIGYSSDMRVFADVFQVNAMLRGALDDLVTNQEQLIEKLLSFLAKIKS